MIRDRKTLLLLGLYAVIIIVACYAGYRYMAVGRAINNLDKLYDVSFNQFQGRPNAKKIIVEFMDYRCTYCRDVHETLMDLLEKDPDVKIIYRHYPVFGRPSLIEAEIALAAGMQGKFVEAHNILIARKEPIADREIDAMAQSLGLNVKKFRTDMKDRDMGYLLLNTLDIGEALGINSTPTFLIGDEVFKLDNGMPTVETFEEKLAEVYGE